MAKLIPIPTINKRRAIVGGVLLALLLGLLLESYLFLATLNIIKAEFSRLLDNGLRKNQESVVLYILPQTNLNNRLEVAKIIVKPPIVIDITSSQWQTLSRVEVPLLKADYYQGKSANASAGAKQVNRIGAIKNSKIIKLVRDKIINMQPRYGYVDTPKGFAYGVCWVSSTLGHAQNTANSEFKRRFGMNLFIFTERQGHSLKYPSLYQVNKGYGYAIFDSSYLIMDYAFKINPAVFQKFPGLEVKHTIKMVDNPEAYRNLSLQGEVQLRFRQQ